MLNIFSFIRTCMLLDSVVNPASQQADRINRLFKLLQHSSCRHVVARNSFGSIYLYQIQV